MSRNGKNGRLDVRKTYKMLIGGAFVRSESGRALDVEAPGGRWLGHVCRASRKDFRNAVVAARKAAWAEASVVTFVFTPATLPRMLEVAWFSAFSRSCCCSPSVGMRRVNVTPEEYETREYRMSTFAK